MKPIELKNRFIEMRAEGQSYSDIAQQLHISKSTCTTWERELEAEIAQLKKEELNALYESLQSALYDNGFSRERKRFTPHITLGRNVEHDELATLELKQLSPNASMTVMGITLFESRREEGKVAYYPLHTERF